MERVQAIVIGAGVVGLAVARALALAGREVMVLEAAEAIGTGVSSRNSEVIHAGVYYPPGSLKARACIAGKDMLYAYCETRGVKTKRVGKIIVATQDAQIPDLEKMRANAAACGMHDLSMISRAEALEMEPQVHCVAALHSPTTGIIDSHGLMLAFQGDIENAGGMVVFHAPVMALAAEDHGYRVELGGEAPMSLGCDILVNAASLAAPGLAAGMGGYDASLAPKAYLAKGNYFSLTGVKPPFRGLVYPVPEPGGLGIHATVDLGGQVRFGPDVQWIDAVDYTPDVSRTEKFRQAITSYWPSVPEGALVASYTGIRPKIAGPGEPNADFVVQGPATHGLNGLVHMFGIESPGLTSSLALAEVVMSALDQRLVQAAE
ncbi:MAG: NAD(P)/FAD-dependent oxidoreductase [Bosea sp. (in: a-proteobacteria)]